ncbi:Malate dehydrogenase (oxaloacetate- decarboxylating) [Thermanaerovibrio acidaminovorans DSM 6589]|jgi:malate dehydrogenase (oxaloacetate-decarboxylating)|uniref:Malate dehydrogenase (Oxaloacetate-decarboxylating) n=1 Tax=Thermanaerovibrio acidaminovorans (strain ATCC 49978 / DSM 6589 / Su883) TaxID=525903 RepID=D1B851_THEAS|nr:NADP-dependent malic enzyme [Thermanaerovibrio acidaminovorans]ACZ18454.1 Malate dehydrogenase (oxaloacetate- decarboxylating) [Thermanaerovibrio acidaminovorans DSM 6589]
MSDVYQRSLELHRAHRGKISVESRVPIETREDLALAYTPGVAEPCRAIEADPAEAYRLTSKGNMVAVVTDGSAVLGLGDIGPLAALPVMEGKCCLFKHFAQVDAVPLCVDERDPDRFVDAVAKVSVSFGGINLEDIAAPRCFEIERKLQERLDIPVFHDDQHGTAVVVAAALMNALELLGRPLEDCRVVMNGIGAAGSSIAEMLIHLGCRDLVLCDRYGVMDRDDPRLSDRQRELAGLTNPRRVKGGLAEALSGAQVFIGVSKGGILTREMVSSMAKDPIVFAMANPVPEIFPEEALSAGAFVVATGRSDFPNQVNNCLGFPGIFKGALSVRAREINMEMKLAAARAIRDVIASEVERDRVIPDALDPRVVPAVARAVAEAAVRTGVARTIG